MGQAGAGDHDGQVIRKARRGGQISSESHRVTGTEPGGPPPRSTATTLTDQLVTRHRALALHDEHIELHAELIAAEVAHQLAMARSALHRHPSLRRAG